MAAGTNRNPFLPVLRLFRSGLSPRSCRIDGIHYKVAASRGALVHVWRWKLVRCLDFRTAIFTPGMERPFLTAQNIVKKYGGDGATHVALRGLSVTADRGDFIAVRGPSGCGKSTLLHVLGAMDRPTEGSVHLNGRRLDNLDLQELAVVRRRHIGFIFQAFNLMPTMSVIENVALPLLLDGMSEGSSSELSRAALADVGMSARVDFFPSQLSGGEMQRVAIARALAITPELVIADEPTGSLDSVNGNRVLELLASLNASRNITILMATHSNEAAAFASRCIDVKDGQLAGEADADAIPPVV